MRRLQGVLLESLDSKVCFLPSINMDITFTHWTPNVSAVLSVQESSGLPLVAFSMSACQKARCEEALGINLAIMIVHSVIHWRLAISESLESMPEPFMVLCNDVWKNLLPIPVRHLLLHAAVFLNISVVLASRINPGTKLQLFSMQCSVRVGIAYLLSQQHRSFIGPWNEDEKASLCSLSLSLNLVFDRCLRLFAGKVS